MPLPWAETVIVVASKVPPASYVHWFSLQDTKDPSMAAKASIGIMRAFIIFGFRDIFYAGMALFTKVRILCQLVLKSVAEEFHYLFQMDPVRTFYKDAVVFNGVLLEESQQVICIGKEFVSGLLGRFGKAVPDQIGFLDSLEL